MKKIYLYVEMKWTRSLLHSRTWWKIICSYADRQNRADLKTSSQKSTDKKEKEQWELYKNLIEQIGHPTVVSSGRVIAVRLALRYISGDQAVNIIAPSDDPGEAEIISMIIAAASVIWNLMTYAAQKCKTTDERMEFAWIHGAK